MRAYIQWYAGVDLPKICGLRMNMDNCLQRLTPKQVIPLHGQIKILILHDYFNDLQDTSISSWCIGFDPDSAHKLTFAYTRILSHYTLCHCHWAERDLLQAFFLLKPSPIAMCWVSGSLDVNIRPACETFSFLYSIVIEGSCKPPMHRDGSAQLVNPDHMVISGFGF